MSATETEAQLAELFVKRPRRRFRWWKLLPQGITPSSHNTQWNATAEELERHGTLWLAHDAPFVLIDGIQTQEERMERYRKQMDEMCREINARLAGKRQAGSP